MYDIERWLSNQIPDACPSATETKEVDIDVPAIGTKGRATCNSQKNYKFSPTCEDCPLRPPGVDLDLTYVRN